MADVHGHVDDSMHLEFRCSLKIPSFLALRNEYKGRSFHTQLRANRKQTALVSTLGAQEI